MKIHSCTDAYQAAAAFSPPVFGGQYQTNSKPEDFSEDPFNWPLGVGEWHLERIPPKQRVPENSAHPLNRHENA